MNAEHIIKAALDGNFFVITFGGQTRSRSVPFDHIPDHRPLYGRLEEEEGPHHNVAEFSDVEDETILAMRESKHRWADVARALRRCIHAVRDRYSRLCVDRGIEPIERLARTGPPAKFSPEDKLRMLRMRDKGMSYDKIAARVGGSRWMVADSISKLRRKMEAQ